MGYVYQLLVESCSLQCLRLIQRARAWTRSPQAADLIVVEVVAAVGPQDVGEVAHERVVLPGLMARTVWDFGLVRLEPPADLVVLLPRRRGRRRRVETEGLAPPVAVLP